MGDMQVRERVHHWYEVALCRRDELSLPAKVALCLLMAALTGLAAQVRVRLPVTPVPVTGQVFAVLLSGALLGGGLGGLAQALYVGLGAAGVPWFSGMAGGLTLGPTAGYLLGFIPAAAFVGWACGRFAAARHFGGLFLVMAGGIALIYLFGALWFRFATGLGSVTTVRMAVLPFIVVDLVKAAAAASIAKLFLPREKIRQ